jgi:hypothetical protein
VEEDLKEMKLRNWREVQKYKIVEWNHKVGQNPPKVVVAIEEEEYGLYTLHAGYLRLEIHNQVM